MSRKAIGSDRFYLQMLLYIFILLTAFAWSLAFAPSAGYAAPEDEVEFADEVLEQAVRNQLNYLGILADAEEPITIGHMQDQRFTRFEVYGNQAGTIVDITPLQYATHLTMLAINYNGVQDISAITSLQNLSELYLSGNAITDISALVDMPNLETAVFSDNYITTIGTLAGLDNLWELDLSFNHISDISSIEAVPNLDSINLSYNELTDIGGLSSSTSLTSVILDGNRISDLSPLAQLPNLMMIYLNDNEVSDVSPLAQLAMLDILELSFNRISDISPLGQNDSIYNLELDSNQILNISPLLEMDNLAYVRIGNNAFTVASASQTIQALRTKGVDVILDVWYPYWPYGSSLHFIQSGDFTSGELVWDSAMNNMEVRIELYEVSMDHDGSVTTLGQVEHVDQQGKHRFQVDGLEVGETYTFTVEMIALHPEYNDTLSVTKTIVQTEPVQVQLVPDSEHVDLEDEVVISAQVDGLQDLYAFEWTIAYPENFELTDISLDPQFGAGEASIQYTNHEQSRTISMNGSLTGDRSLDASEHPVRVVNLTFTPAGNQSTGTFTLLADGGNVASSEELLYPIADDYSIDVETYIAVKELTVLTANELLMPKTGYEPISVSFGPDLATYKELIWEISDPSVVQVYSQEEPMFDQQSGKYVQVTQIYANDVGQTDITIKSKYGEVMDTISVTVGTLQIDGEERFELSVVEHELYDQTVTLHATILPEALSDQPIIWESDDETVATVDQNGKVTAVGVGTATITASAANGVLFDYRYVDVYHPLTWSSSHDKAIYYLGERFPIAVHLDNELTNVTNGTLFMMFGVDSPGLVVENVRLADGIPGTIELKGYMAPPNIVAVAVTGLDLSTVEPGDPVVIFDVVSTASGEVLYGIGPTTIFDEYGNEYGYAGDEQLNRTVSVANQDANDDLKFNIADLVRVSKHFNITSGSPDYSANYDMNRDGVINIIDISFISLLLLENIPEMIDQYPVPVPLPSEDIPIVD